MITYVERIKSQVAQLSERQRIVCIGLCFGSGFLHPFLAVISVVGLYWFCVALNRASTLKSCIRLAWGVWYIKSLMVVAWFWSAYPIQWLPFQSEIIQLPVIALYWLSAAFWLSAAGVVFGGAVWYVRQYVRNRTVVILTLTLMFVVAEQVGALVFSLATLGPGISPNIYFGFGQFGMILATLPGLVALSWWGGVYGLTLLLVAGTLFVVWGQWQTIVWRICLVVVLLYGASTVTHLFWSYPSAPAQIAVIDTEFDAMLLAASDGATIKQAVLADAVKAARGLAVSHIILPEDSRFLQTLSGVGTTKQGTASFQFLFPGAPVVLIDSGRLEVTAERSVMRATTFDTGLGKLLEYDKQYLVPQGEFIPYLYAGLLRLIGFGATIDALESSYTYYPGRTNQVTDSVLPPILFCFESVNPLGVSQAIQNDDVPFIAHPISHAWFNHPQLLQNQLTTLLRIQAVWNQVPIVSAANRGESAVYYPNGMVGQGEVVATGERYTIRLVTLP
jgi:apolipoprotein N-acyltransferase